MQFSEIESSVREILKLDFDERDREIHASVLGIKQEMINRGLIVSTMSAQSLAEFFFAEFKVRIDSIAERSLWALRSDDAMVDLNGVPAGRALFQTLANDQLTRLLTAYDSYVAPIVAPLQSNMPVQIRDRLVERTSGYMRRIDLAVDLEYKSHAGAAKEVLTLRPTIYGVGVDLKELWKRFFG